METRDKQVIKQFLDELEKWLLKQEMGIDSIKERARQRRYIEEVVDRVLELKEDGLWEMIWI